MQSTDWSSLAFHAVNVHFFTTINYFTTTAFVAAAATQLAAIVQSGDVALMQQKHREF